MTKVQTGVLRAALAAMVVAGPLALAGCPDDEVQPTADATIDVPLADGEGDAADVVPDVEPDLPDEDVSDVAEVEDDVVDVADSTDAADTDDAADATDATDAMDTADDGGPEDVGPPDNDPPFVESTSPAAGEDMVAIPFEVTITFNEKIAANTIAPSTVKIFNAQGNEPSGTLEVQPDGKTVKFTFAAPDTQARASAYRIWLTGGIIADLAGNKLAEPYEVWFFTEGYPNTEAYDAVAATYAPTITSAVTSVSAWQVPVAVDLDGDWDASNNRDYIQQTASELAPTVYYSVTDTYTHYFIHYMYYFPYMNHPTSSAVHGNGVSGALVTVEKAHGSNLEERPIAVTTYFKNNNNDESYTYVTTESGIVATLDPSDYNVDGVYDQDVLFPQGRFDAYVTAGSHESCVMVATDDTAPCLFEPTNSLVFAYKDGAVDDLVKGIAWPADMSAIADLDELGYGLVNVDTVLWPRRVLDGPNEIWDGTFSYDADTARPGDGLVVPSKFVDPIDDLDSWFGRPVWAWRWNPAVGPIVGSNPGEFGIDPAWHLWKRHHSVQDTNAVSDFDETTGEGFSVTYCLNVKALIDKRDTDPLCQSVPVATP